ncbi:MarR family transcriptional regulator [Catellatospora sp. KI3]|uniref:MarR family winged helix-turn-helix transcriptional regulator n=1 Tax=Catellatospora sp. KI3 TaxID=3041620 RepID=UPI00248323A4|nr:MarR family transcriptional regulator [Catellatospora sp. KI3]MDI1466059.1 MarR family transcriptional regulator [Catellatospora sp. KI3]
MTTPIGDPTDYVVGLLLRRAHRRASRVFGQALLPLGIEPPHFGVLHTLARLGPLSQRGLIDQLGSDKSAMVRTVDDLERLGYAQRRPAQGDRRAYAVELTPAGRQALADGVAAAQEAAEEFLGDLDQDERATLKSLLTRLLPTPSP